jgi:large subunit ribosomal protein L22
MPGPKTNEREGTRAMLRYCGTSAFKIRPVLDLVRGKEVGEAREILRFSERDAARIVGKLLDSAVANAAENDKLDPEELFVSACFADEGMTHKRWRPRARGRATRIRKRTSHITVIVSRLPEDKLARLRAKRAAETQNRRARRVAAGRQGRRTRRDEQLPGTAEPVNAEAADTVEQTIAEQDAAAVETEAVETDAVEAGVEEAAAAESTEEPTAAEVAEAEEAEGIVDQQAPAVAAAEEAEADEAETEKEEGE